MLECDLLDRLLCPLNILLLFRAVPDRFLPLLLNYLAVIITVFR